MCKNIMILFKYWNKIVAMGFSRKIVKPDLKDEF